MKKVILVIAGLCICLSGCGGENSISKEEYDLIVDENERLKAENTEMSGEMEEISSEKDKIQNEYKEYKEEMKEYEGLKKEEAQAREIEAKKIIEEQKAADEQKAAEEAARKEQEEKQGYETGITYEQLARTPDDYEGKKVKFSGKVVQAIEGDESIQIRLAVDSDYDSILLCQYDKSIVQSRILEDDIITIYGTSVGLITYESTMGGNITIPGVSIEKIDQQNQFSIGQKCPIGFIKFKNILYFANCVILRKQMVLYEREKVYG